MDHKHDDWTPPLARVMGLVGNNNNNLFLVVDGFRCKRCDGTIPEANIAENLLVNGEMYGCVISLYFVWDTVDGDGGTHLSTTVIIRD